MKNLKKTITWNQNMFLTLFVLCMAVFAFPFHAQAEEADSEITIYGLDSSATEVISIPDEFPQGHQLTISSGKTVTYRVESGESAQVSSEGYISPKFTYWKRYPGYSTSVPEGQEYDYYTVETGDTTISANTGDRIYRVLVHVKNYSITYGDGVMDAYIKENINDTMSDEEVMKAVAKFPASYDYSASYSGVYSMIIYGGGDCWASTDAIITLCDKLGIKAWARNGNKDLGAGSGHMNAMAELNGKYYVLEAGYSMSKIDGYRPYDVTERKSLYSYRYGSSANEIDIYQYDGYDTTGVLEIPETIEGKTVTGIEKSAFASTKFSEIILPDTLTSIGDFAFSSCQNLEKITIPASVTSLGSSVFTSCTGLKEIQVAQDNPNYIEKDQVIYSKDGATLITCPVAGKVTIPSTVTKIADYAFYYNPNLQTIIIPESVTQMGEGAFGNCSKLSSVTFAGNGITDIGTHCFRSNAALTVIRIPASVKMLGAYAFAYCNKLKYIYFMGDAPEFGETIDGTFYDRVFMGCTADAYYMEEKAWRLEDLSDHDGTITWSTWDGETGSSLENAVVTFGEKSYVYTGAYITPEVTVTLDGVTLVKDKDYIIAFSDNRDAGVATVSVTGIGAYEGSILKTFTIGKAERKVSVYLQNNRVAEKDTTKVLYLPSGEDYTCSSSDTSVATIDSAGVITGVSAGNAVITVRVAETENYLAGQASAEIRVTHSNNISVAGSEVVNGTIKVKCDVCGAVYDATVPTQYSIYWAKPGDSVYYSYCNSKWQVGEALQCMCMTSDVDLDEMEVVSLNEKVVSITGNNRLNFIADGTAQVVVRPKYNPSIGRTFTFYVGNATGGNGGDEQDQDKNQNGDGGKDQDTGKEKNIKYYDAGTGITIQADKSKKTATVVSVDKKAGKSSLTVPDTIKVDGTTYKITEIGKDAWKNNKNLKKIVLGKNVKTIGAGAFSGCSKLRTVVIGKNVSKIGKKAFYKCKKLKSITIKSKKLTNKNVGSKAFKGIHAKASIKVPKSKQSAYKKLLKAKGAGSKVKIKK